LQQACIMFFHSWADIGRVVVTTAIVFVAITAFLRLVGAQAIAKMSGYDMVATVTFGSIVATVALTRNITITEGLAAIVTLIALQELMRRAQSRWLIVHHAVREPPLVILWQGDLLEDRLIARGISADEVRAAVRKAGMRSLADALIVVLENDGEWSVIRRTEQPSDDSALLGLPIPDRVGNTRTKDGHVAERAPSTRLP
jgi:uncharacterized membrane protein YcaP (DUF421 family)